MKDMKLMTPARYDSLVRMAARFLVAQCGDARFSNREVNYLFVEGMLIGWLRAQYWVQAYIAWSRKAYPRDDVQLLLQDQAVQALSDAFLLLTENQRRNFKQN